MAEKLLEYYQYVENQYDIETKQELGWATSLPRHRASFEADSDENIEKLRTAIERITGEEPPEF
ncbi:hypothetical protein [Haloarcula japonica]|uniref:Uncharacterized protein n=1 Tax=Haloarcula japonica (strain ATCC 49778 / DSM 6131 / JCM 7785 / NBRC 101032 / NCIMB 13157 / TR-1) TaxID=1227453 RepID=M0L3J5_HALJT|nr:hypothetical protein [Haloarcula japonica]EMA26994.1 hypothetical protein C444_21261 [Haloarcula japonica DSM 6131]